MFFFCTFPYNSILYALAVVFFIWVYISFPLSAYFLLSFSAIVCIILLFHIILSELFFALIFFFICGFVQNCWLSRCFECLSHDYISLLLLLLFRFVRLSECKFGYLLLFWFLFISLFFSSITRYAYLHIPLHLLLNTIYI